MPALQGRNCDQTSASQPLHGVGSVDAGKRHGMPLPGGAVDDEFAGSEFDRCLHGVLDQVGLFSRTLTDQEIWDFYTFTQMPTKVDYIRD